MGLDIDGVYEEAVGVYAEREIGVDVRVRAVGEGENRRGEVEDPGGPGQYRWARACPRVSCTAWFENFNETAYAILFKPVDRVIPDLGKGNLPESAVYNDVYNYTARDPYIGNVTIETSTGVTTARYPSQTYQKYCTYMDAVRPPALTMVDVHAAGFGTGALHGEINA